MIENELLETARKLITSETVSCVVISGGEIIHTADGRGVSPLLSIFQDEPEKLRGAAVVDRVIGKAAAVILAAGGAAAVYGEIMSVAARNYLARRNIQVQYGKWVDRISSRDGTDMCPIEKSVLAIDDPAEGVKAICRRLEELRGGSQRIA
ncbi:DUF1893 domain-containing protein [Breznakiella homolactica]|uniref:DUF1893 domain-containing protein n=1 Tax=Breznakiella homolactica TaxID=2798577 RepID=A0A7T7XR34_9SPIR|nr:DUF1893 domain-containing protein [Breznakiella homolactica]QQO10947.1 DUF1893 domain-containing protein [Breznakiella homolactica]